MGTNLFHLINPIFSFLYLQAALTFYNFPGYYCTGSATAAAPNDGYATGGLCLAGSFCPSQSCAPTPCTEGSYCDSPGKLPSISPDKTKINCMLGKERAGSVVSLGKLRPGEGGRGSSTLFIILGWSFQLHYLWQIYSPDFYAALFCRTGFCVWTL